jgi:hypothetical protein
MEKKFERRDKTRFYLKNSLARIDPDANPNFELETINFSQGGILFRSNLPMKEKQIVTLQFELHGESEERMVTDCCIMHVLETIPGKQYFIGGEFEGSEDFGAERLLEYFEGQEKQ